MATDVRLARLERLALRRAGEIVLHELADPRLTFVTITRVKLSADLSHGTIYWSTLGEGGQRTKVEHALRDSAPVVQSEIAKAFRTRRTPHIVFKFDESIEGASRVSGILDAIKKERIARTGGDEVQGGGEEE